MRFSQTGKVWKYEGHSPWYFVYIDREHAAKIKQAGVTTTGFGYVPVTADIDGVKWDTTLFPSKEGVYLLAIKAEIRKRVGIYEGDTVSVVCYLD
jgi:hypothetical protein